MKEQLGGALWEPPSGRAAEEFCALTLDRDREQCRGAFLSVVSRCKQYIPIPRTRTTLAKFLQKRIACREPASVLRVGDGEGNLLFHLLRRYPILDEYCLRRISKIYFGNETTIIANGPHFTDLLLTALRSADVIGGPEWGSIERSFDTPAYELDVRAACGFRGVYLYLSKHAPEFDFRETLWSSSWLSRHLLGSFQKLLSHLDYLCVLSCYPGLGPRLARHVQAGKLESILVPTQASLRYELANRLQTDNRHYPEHYLRTLAAIRPPRRGAVYIVAAGILGKSYCDAIKQRGGIAIDVGSVADVWMGVASRPGMKAAFVNKWRLPTLQAQGRKLCPSRG